MATRQYAISEVKNADRVANSSAFATDRHNDLVQIRIKGFEDRRILQASLDTEKDFLLLKYEDLITKEYRVKVIQNKVESIVSNATSYLFTDLEDLRLTEQTELPDVFTL